MLIYMGIKMKKVIRKILKEENENMKEKVKTSFQTLLYIIESNIQRGFIKEVTLENAIFDDRFKTVEGSINVKAYCDDPDVGAFTSIVDEIDTKIYGVIKNYEFDRDGSLKKNQEKETYLMFLFKSCQWDWGTNELHMGYAIIQDEFRS